MPTAAKLSDKRPDRITKEPQYQGTPKYAVITVGNGTPNQFVLVADEAEGHEPKLYADLNGDGDLTNDGNGDWQTKSKKAPKADSSATRAHYAFKAGWKTPDGSQRRW